MKEFLFKNLENIYLRSDTGLTEISRKIFDKDWAMLGRVYQDYVDHQESQTKTGPKQSSIIIRLPSSEMRCSLGRKSNRNRAQKTKRKSKKLPGIALPITFAPLALWRKSQKTLYCPVILPLMFPAILPKGLRKAMKICGP